MLVLNKCISLQHLLVTHDMVFEKCYGKNLATGEKVEVGEAVGTIAAQLYLVNQVHSLQCIHPSMAGVTGHDITQGLPSIQEIFRST